MKFFESALKGSAHEKGLELGTAGGFEKRKYRKGSIPRRLRRTRYPFELFFFFFKKGHSSLACLWYGAYILRQLGILWIRRLWSSRKNTVLTSLVTCRGVFIFHFCFNPWKQRRDLRSDSDAVVGRKGRVVFGVSEDTFELSRELAGNKATAKKIGPRYIAESWVHDISAWQGMEGMDGHGNFGNYEIMNMSTHTHARTRTRTHKSITYLTALLISFIMMRMGLLLEV